MQYKCKKHHTWKKRTHEIEGSNDTVSDGLILNTKDNIWQWAIPLKRWNKVSRANHLKATRPKKLIMTKLFHGDINLSPTTQ